MVALIYIIKSLILIVYILLMVAFYTILERKIIAYMQRRRGPNVVGPFGLLQAISDALKLLVKKTIYPQSANILIFIAGPMITFVLSYSSWVVIPFAPEAVFSNTSLGVLYLLAFSALSLYGLVMGGWASNSKYAFFGAIRAISQMISYEVSLGLILICVVCCAGTLNLSGIVLSQTNNWFILPHFPLFFLFFISALAETNRHPFDFAEAESELVSGYNTEYGSLLFVLFFLAEYSNMILMSTLISILFLGGWLFPFSNIIMFSGQDGDFLTNSSFILGIKALILMNFFVIVRATYPRLRYDQLMQYCWKIILPFTLAWFVFTVCLLKLLNACPPINGPLMSFYNFCGNYNFYNLCYTAHNANCSFDPLVVTVDGLNNQPINDLWVITHDQWVTQWEVGNNSLFRNDQIAKYPFIGNEILYSLQTRVDFVSSNFETNNPL
jgi:NADH-quinone oxidoreductase subunit H